MAIVDTTVSRADAVRAFRKLKKSGNASIVVITAKENGAGSADLAADADVLLAKPFDPRELVLIIRGMLHGRTRGASSPLLKIRNGRDTPSAARSAARRHR